jgi:ferric-dicitrate binding protein FerR (iron transport regulator)
MGNVPSHPIALDVLDRYWTGTASLEEVAAVEQWIAADPRRVALIHRPLSAAEDEVLTEAAWARVAERAQIEASAVPTSTLVARHTTNESPSDPSSNPASEAPRAYDGHVGSRRSRVTVSPPSSWSQVSRWAVVALAMVAVVIGVRTLPFVRPLASREYVASAGHRVTVSLGDGSRVFLAPNSRLLVPSGFGDAERRVILDGEAFVTVAHASGAPFVVQTGRVETRVLGTAFDIRRYPGDSAVHLTVVTGRVSVRNLRGAARLAAGDVSVITDSSTTVLAGADVQGSIAWTRGRLIFTDTPVPTLLTTLERWYGYHFELSDTTLRRRYVTATFDVTKPAEAMAVLKGILNVTMTFDGDRVTLRPGPDTLRAMPPSRRSVWPFMSPSKEMGR